MKKKKNIKGTNIDLPMHKFPNSSKATITSISIISTFKFGITTA